MPIFALGEARDDGEMSDYHAFLSGPNFQNLINFIPYRAEALDAATDSLDTEKVLRCYMCLNDTLCLRVSQTYFCHCCGFRIVSDAIGFADCAFCESQNGVFFDSLNTSNDMHYGKCMGCEIKQWTWECEDCGTVVSQLDERGRKRCPTC